MIPFSDSRFPGDAKASHFQLVLRRRPDGKLPELDPDVLEELSQIIAYLEALRAHIKDGRQGPLPLPQSPVPRDPHAQNREAFRVNNKDAARSPVSVPQLTLPHHRKLHAKKLEAARVRLGSRLRDNPSLVGEGLLRDLALLTDSKVLADHTAPGAPEVEAPETPPVRKPASPAAPGRRTKWLLPLAGMAVLAVLGLAAFFWARPVAAPRENRAALEASTETAVSVEASRAAELVLRSIQRGRLEEASGLLAEARKRGLLLPGLRYQAALLALRQGDVRMAMEWLSQSIAARESVPECLYLRANAAATNGDYTTVCESFDEAAGFAPFSPRYFFFWGEALRRYGHPAEALPQFERALLCRPSTTDGDLIRFKMALAEIEAGADERSEARLQSVLTQKDVPGDALLLAMAAEINRAAYPAAAEYLQRARQAMPPAMLAARLRDFLFQSRARQPDLAAVWPVTIPAGPVEPAAQARARIVVDPATRSLAEADPAVW